MQILHPFRVAKRAGSPSPRLPLLVRCPALFRGGRAKALRVERGLRAGDADLAGVRIPGAMQGRSLRPLLEGKEPGDWRTSTYHTDYENSWALRGKGKEAMSGPISRYFTAHRVGPHRGARDERYKLIHYYSAGDYRELFDIEKDPDEARNAYSEAYYAAIRDSLKKKPGRLKRYYRDNS